MYKILEDEVMLRVDNKWHSTTAVLTAVSGGLQVNFVAEDGSVLKSQAYSRSVYGKGAKVDNGFEKETPSLNDENIFTKHLLDLGLSNT